MVVVGLNWLNFSAVEMLVDADRSGRRRRRHASDRRQYALCRLPRTLLRTTDRRQHQRYANFFFVRLIRRAIFIVCVRRQTAL